MAIAKNRVSRTAFLLLGLLMTGIAFAGIVIPGLPSTGPILLAGYSFSRSSERFDRWLLSHRLFGPVVRSWRLYHGFTQRVKQLSLVGISVTFGLSLYLTDWNWLVRIGFITFAVLLSAWIWTRPSVDSADLSELTEYSYEEGVS